MALLLVGLNHRTAPVELRERLYLPTDTLQNVLTQLHTHSNSIDEIAMLSTCNRFEVYTATNDSAATQSDIVDFLCEYYAFAEHELRPHLYIHHDQLAVQHVMAVASGLDSMVLGEDQILGQVISALKAAAAVNTTGTYLHRLLESAIHTGKRARTETAISQHTTSISHAAAILMEQEMPKPDPSVLIMGAGEMAELAVFAVHRYGLSHLGVINRTYRKANELATKYGAVAYEWSRLWDLLAEVDVVITATGAPHTLLHAEDMARIADKRDEPLMLIDIAVPRDVAPDVAEIPKMNSFDIDALQGIVDSNLAARKTCVPEVEAIIRHEADQFMQWLRERYVVPLIRGLREEVSSVMQTELADAMNKMPELTSDEYAVVQRMLHRIMNKVLHAPMTNLRSHANEQDAELYADMVRDLFSLQDEPDDDARRYA
ncbi:MAG: glutamyl-tRNA reductase [Chloroflexota bacterium]